MCEVSHVTVSVTSQNDSHCVYLSMRINIFFVKEVITDSHLIIFND